MKMHENIRNDRNRFGFQGILHVDARAASRRSGRTILQSKYKLTFFQKLISTPKQQNSATYEKTARTRI